ncbi:endolytic transglycosylase MltG [Streptomyces yaizuensis]|uniref:Endolytic murein transglycosylase n=1 Tax=Streptomyces yaizuensis TaxID=2989713 RepID=A0ABQ5P1A6_9ACTN|nr:endolytic transglycosylase MltG [Streptomyces sp. YSPA8]GLF96385.1 endolytic transglycosylase MltG [Streptomyces sp. YSPA8]
MTEYGRGPDSGPWPPEDPLFGNPDWAAAQGPEGQAHQGQHGHPGQHGQHGHPEQHGHQGQHGHPGQQPYAQQPYAGAPDAYQQQYAQAQQQYPADAQQYAPQQGQPYPVDPQHVQHQQPAPPYEGQGGQPGQDPHHQGVAGYAEQQAYPAPQQQPYGEQQYIGGWDAGQQTALSYDPAQAAAAPGDPYGGQAPDPYTTPDAYPPPEPPGRRTGRGADGGDGTDTTGTAAEAVPDEPPTGGGGDDGPDEEPRTAGSRRDGRGGGRSRKPPAKQKQKKSRNGVACLVVAVVLAGGVGGVGYFGYQFWQGRFGPAPDYSGAGTGTIQVEVPQGAVGSEIGRILKKAGVVKSVDAFVSAQSNNPDGQVQAGVYTLKKQMSGVAALTAMLDPKSRNALIIPEGRRNAWVYEQIDKRLELDAGTTRKVAKEKVNTLGLPAWAKGRPNLIDPLEGFLFPASYPVAKGTAPEKVLKSMVTRAVTEYERVDLAAEARRLKLDGPWQLITVASMVQAEGKTEDDFRKMSEVVYNRLKPDNVESYGRIEFDSAYNYLKGKSEIRISLEKIRNDPHVYNTYYHKGLPPGPIGNPGMEALEAAIKPTNDGWIYFVATDGMNKTEFARDLDSFNRLVEKFNESGVE